ncbi:hypothetical protein ACWGJ9_08735 [Curtobacterium citreum]
MTIYSVGISALLTTVVAGALSVVVLIASGFVSTSIARSDEAQARQLWATSLGNASSVSVLGSNKVIAYSYPDSRPGTYTTTAQDQTCVKTTWATSSGQLTATVERWSNGSCDRANGGAAATSKVTAVALDGVSDVAIGATNVGGRDLHFTTAGTEVGTTSTGATASTNAYPGDGGVSDAEWNSAAPRTLTLTGKVTSLAGASSLSWQATTSLRPSITTASVDEGLRFTPMNPVRFSLGSVSTTPVVTTLAGVNGIPADAVAVTMNVEATAPSANLNVRLNPAGKPYDVAQAAAKSGVNGVSQYATVTLSGGKVETSVSTGTATMYLDVSGYYSKNAAASTYFPQTATRAATASLTTAYKAVPLAGVPASATAVAVNVQVVNPSATGYIRVTANGATDVSVAQQYLTASTDTSNLITMGVTNGALQAKLSAGTATAYFDVVGYYAKDPAGATYVPLDMTRTWSGTVTSTKTQVQVADSAGIPTNAVAVTANLFLTAPSATLYVRTNPGTDDSTVYAQRPIVVSTNNGTPVQSLLVNGQVNIKASTGTVKGYLDVYGFFQPAS